MRLRLLRGRRGHACVRRPAIITTHAFGSRLEVVHSLAHNVRHLVRRAWSVRVVITLEEVSREIPRCERPARLVKRRSGTVDGLRDETLLYSGHHRVSLDGCNLLLCQLIRLYMLLRGHHLARIRRIFAALRRATLPYSTFRHYFRSNFVLCEISRDHNTINFEYKRYEI